MEAGTCWRCHGEVEKRELAGWFFKITAYADELLEYCDKLPGWPERVITMQKNWIGKSIGANVVFPLEDGTGAITIFTTRQDTLFGATFMVLAPEHPLVLELCQGERAGGRGAGLCGTGQATGRDLPARPRTWKRKGSSSGARCINPLTKQAIPIYTANFVLMEYGTGAIMAVPTHDQRDFEFAKKYGIPMIVRHPATGPDP